MQSQRLKMINYDLCPECKYCGKTIQFGIRDKEFGGSSPTSTVQFTREEMKIKEVYDVEKFIIKCWNCKEYLIIKVTLSMKVESETVSDKYLKEEDKEK